MQSLIGASELMLMRWQDVNTFGSKSLIVEVLSLNAD